MLAIGCALLRTLLVFCALSCCCLLLLAPGQDCVQQTALQRRFLASGALTELLARGICTPDHGEHTFNHELVPGARHRQEV